MQNNRLLGGRSYPQLTKARVIERTKPNPKTSQSRISSRFLNQKELDPDFIDQNSVNRRYHYPARTYVPFRGAFLQVDPLLLSYGSAPLGVYALSSSNVLTRIDPSGLQDQDADKFPEEPRDCPDSDCGTKRCCLKGWAYFVPGGQPLGALLEKGNRDFAADDYLIGKKWGPNGNTQFTGDTGAFAEFVVQLEAKFGGLADCEVEQWATIRDADKGGQFLAAMRALYGDNTLQKGSTIKEWPNPKANVKWVPRYKHICTISWVDVVGSAGRQNPGLMGTMQFRTCFKSTDPKCPIDRVCVDWMYFVEVSQVVGARPKKAVMQIGGSRISKTGTVESGGLFGY